IVTAAQRSQFQTMNTTVTLDDSIPRSIATPIAAVVSPAGSGALGTFFLRQLLFRRCCDALGADQDQASAIRSGRSAASISTSRGRPRHSVGRSCPQGADM